MSKQLGKGLGELFVDNSYLKEANNTEQIGTISLNKIVPNPFQPRKYFDPKRLEELAESIKVNGVFTPIIVTFDGFNYVIVAGERRYRACQLAGETTIPAIVRDYSEKAMMEVALLENIQREDLSAIEVAESYKQIIDRLSLSHEEFATRIGKSRAQVTNMLGLLNLPIEIIALVNEGKISQGHARVLSKMDDVSRMLALANRVVNSSLSVRDLEVIARDESKKREIKKVKKPNYSSYERNLKDKNIFAKISSNKIVIKFENEEELKAILKKIN